MDAAIGAMTLCIVFLFVYRSDVEEVSLSGITSS
jgi:hypothetical protein